MVPQLALFTVYKSTTEPGCGGFQLISIPTEPSGLTSSMASTSKSIGGLERSRSVAAVFISKGVVKSSLSGNILVGSVEIIKKSNGDVGNSGVVSLPGSSSFSEIHSPHDVM